MFVLRHRHTGDMAGVSGYTTDLRKIRRYGSVEEAAREKEREQEVWEIRLDLVLEADTVITTNHKGGQ